MFEREKYNLEFKEKVTRTFLKTVSAFSNYNDGQIIFGINDNVKVVGLADADDEALKIENMINTAIKPVPHYELEFTSLYGKQIIVLNIFKGNNTPYYYQGKTYRRSNTSTVEVDRPELKRLVLEGFNIEYDEIQVLKYDLDFSTLERELKSKIGIETLNVDILKTLNLFDENGYYNFAGELLSDSNEQEFAGINIVKFGKNIKQILYRETLNNTSILDQYYKAIEIFERYYQFEEIEEYNTVKKELIPIVAFKEALANAIVHRVWDIKSHIKIDMYVDRLEIDSPGGIPDGISEADFLKVNVSVLRNPIIAGVFYRLEIIEKHGTGINRILNAYQDSITKPTFKINSDNIKIILPVVEKNLMNLTEDEKTIYNTLKNNGELFRREIDEYTGYNKSKTVRIINKLINKKIVEKLGRGPSTTYNLKYSK